MRRIVFQSVHTAPPSLRSRAIHLAGVLPVLFVLCTLVPHAHAKLLSEGTNEAVGYSCAQWREWNERNAGSSAITVSKCWDFETGELGDSYWGRWTVVAQRGWTAFANQPTFGDNVRAGRVFRGGDRGRQLNGIGGDYWNVPAPIGHQGQFWIGTYENRPNHAAPWARTQGDQPQGKIVSPPFVVDRKYLTFLIGGDCRSGYLGIEVFTPGKSGVLPTRLQAPTRTPAPSSKTAPVGTWALARYPANDQPMIMRARACNEGMERRLLHTPAASGLQGKTVRVVVADDSSRDWGHVNVDHIVHTDIFPTRTAGQDQPVWGWADTHAHVGNHLTFRSSMNSPTDGYVFHGDPENTLSCDGAGHGTDHQGGPKLMAILEGASFGEGIAAHDGKGRFLLDWPYWFTRAHQQMRLPWMRRAYEGGQRLMVAAAGNGEILGAFMRENHGQGYVSDFGAMRHFARYMKALAARHSWMEIALSPNDAVRIIRANRLAVVLATEVDDIGDRCDADLTSDFAGVMAADLNLTTSSTGGGSNPWNQVKDRARASTCSSVAQWRKRVQELYSLGYRVVTPVHLTDNEVGGAAVYSDLFNVMQRFNRGTYFNVVSSADYRFKLSNEMYEMGWCQGPACAASAGMGWALIPPIIFATLDTYTPVQIPRATSYPQSSNIGHSNQRGLTDRGVTVLEEMKRRGMIIDVTHMGRSTRDKVLGVGDFSLASIVNPSCNMNNSSCQQSAYPVISSHSAFQALNFDGRGDEAGLTTAQIVRIVRGGGTLAVGTADADLRHVDQAKPAPFNYAIDQQNVANDCGGTSRSFAQGYLLALRHVREQGTGGITLGTDINGLQSQANPRFGTMGCFARGNIPQLFVYDFMGNRLIVDDVPQKETPLRYDRAKLQNDAPGRRGTAGGQRIEQIANASGLNYAHYQRTESVGSDQPLTSVVHPPNGEGGNLHFATRGDPSDYVRSVLDGKGLNLHPGYRSESMRTVAGHPPITPSTDNVAGVDRTFDLNYDGLAHYGMLPDYLQDLRVVGMSQEQMGELFNGANAFIKSWMKSCSLAVPGSVSAAGC